jgi:acyl transferase domain-containing protein/3-hydroxymyristoyl/3-hydroxydecanoyl-(acyl carrier protein) dehydratase
MQQPTRIAIVGFGGVFPGASNLAEFWENIEKGRDSSSDVPPDRWVLPSALALATEPGTPDRVTGIRGCFVQKWQCNSDGLDIDEALLSGLDPLFHLTLQAGREAFASCAARIADKSKVSVVFGNIVLPTEYSSKLARDYIGSAVEHRIFGKTDRQQVINPLNHFAAALPGGVLAKALGLGGGSYTIDAACASSLYALKLAVDDLTSGKYDAVLAGGVSRPDHLYTQMGFTQLTALSKSGRSRPFDAKGDGLVVGEGAGFFVLKRLEDAIKCQDDIHGVITGIGLSNDVDGGLMAPSSEGQLRSMRAAYKNAGISPADIDFIECHATGTPIGDAVEFSSLKALWDEEPNSQTCVLGSVKGNVGHLLTAAGASGLSRILLAMKHETLPPTANFQKAQDRIDLKNSPFEVLTHAKPWIKRSPTCPRRAAISGFGFGGINAHVIIEQWEPASAEMPPAKKVAAGSFPKKRRVAIVGVDSSIATFSGLESIFNFTCVERRELTQSQPKWKGIGAPTGRKLEANKTRTSPMAEVSIPYGRFRIPPIELEQMLPQQLLMLLVADRALTAAGVQKEINIKAGVFIGLGLDTDANAFSCRWEIDACISDWAKRLGLDLDDRQLADWSTALKNSVHSPLNANRTMGALGGLVASRISREFQFGGPSFTVANEANSGIRALQLGMRQIENGELDIALVGAVDFAAQYQTAMSAPLKNIHGKQAYLNRIYSDGAVAFVLKELNAAKEDGNRIYGILDEVAFSGRQFSAAESSTRENEVDFSRRNLLKSGDIGAADALVNLALSVHCMTKSVVPQANGNKLQSWLRNSGEGGRTLKFAAYSSDDNHSHVQISEDMEAPFRLPLKILPFGMFTIRADTAVILADCIESLDEFAVGRSSADINATAREWYAKSRTMQGGISLAIVSADVGQLRQQIRIAGDLLKSDRNNFSEAAAKLLRIKGIFLNKKSEFSDQSIAFLYPGVGQQYLGMGRQFCLAFPEILEKQDLENALLRDQFFINEFWHDSDESLSGYSNGPAFGAQVAFGSLVTEVLKHAGISPAAVLGYSLGESTGLVATRVWQARDEIYTRLVMSPLFREYLGGDSSAVCRHWGLPLGTKIDWSSHTVRSGADEINLVLKDFDRVYLMNINTHRECVIGGDREQVEAVILRLGSESVQIPGLVAMHCAVVSEVKNEYAEFHKMDPVFVGGIRYYSCATGECYLPEKAAIAESLLKHGVEGVNYPKVIEKAYADGVRIFIDIGPGRSLSRMVSEILANKEHIAISMCPSGDQEVEGFLKGLALLYSHGFNLDMRVLFDDGAVEEQTRLPEKRMTIPVGQTELAVVELPTRQGAFVELNRIPSEQPKLARISRNDLTMSDHSVGLSAGSEPTTSDFQMGNSELISAISDTLQATIDAHQKFVVASAQNFAAAGAWIGLQQALLGRGNIEEVVGFDYESTPNYENDNLTQHRDNSHSSQGVVYNGYNDEMRPAPFSRTSPWLDFRQCKEFAVGKIATVLGSDFAEIDNYATRVRLPDGPLLLCHRIMSVDAQPKSMSHGTLVTEHDIFANAWYLDNGRIPTCIAVEAGQADLFLSSYLGIDFLSKGKSVYRLLDAVVTFYRELPKPGETIRYEIKITEFFSQGTTILFRFSFEASVHGEPLLSMRSGCAGFFNEEELAEGRGIVISTIEKRPIAGKLTGGFEYPIPLVDESFSDAQLDCLRQGDYAGCFGSMFSGLDISDPGKLPGGMMKLVHRITGIKNDTGRYGLGVIYGEADIHPNDWFLECHFVDDKVMPGTLMYECCLHTLRVYLMRMGWVGESQDMTCEPIPGEPSKLKCRGQVLSSTKTVTYEIVIKELGYRPEAYAIVDAFMYADGKMIVEITNMTARMAGLRKDKVTALWSSKMLEDSQVRALSCKPAIYDYERIRAYCEGKPSEAFGKAYEIFDGDLRKIARLPREPFCFMSRITETQAKAWTIEAGGMIEAEYDVPEDAWYFAPEAQGKMPFAILLEAALQPCGWYSGYMGSALASDQDLCYRNLGGTAVQYAAVTPWTGTLRTRVDCTKVSQSGGMLIQEFDFTMTAGDVLIYSGQTMFGFFSKEALAQQVGVRGASPLYLQDADRHRAGRPFPEHVSLPIAPMLMIDEVQSLDISGGRNQLGYIRGRKFVNPGEWFFKAHFYQDPVMPGSLGIEAFVQLFKALALEIFSAKDSVTFDVPAQSSTHEWVYRGQVIPTNKVVTTEVEVSKIDFNARVITASGYILVDDLVIYEIKNFSLGVSL